MEFVQPACRPRFRCVPQGICHNSDQASAARCVGGGGGVASCLSGVQMDKGTGICTYKTGNIGLILPTFGWFLSQFLWGILGFRCLLLVEIVTKNSYLGLYWGKNPFPKHFKDTIFTTQTSLRPWTPRSWTPRSGGCSGSFHRTAGTGTIDRSRHRSTGGTQETQWRRLVGRIHTKKHEKHQQLDEIWTKHEG